MENLVAKIEELLVCDSLDALCKVSVVYLTIEDNVLLPYNKALNTLQEASLDYTQEEIDQNIRRDLEVSTVLSDESSLVQNLKIRQKRHFLKMKCELPREIISKCEEFTNNFHRGHMPNNFRNTVHDKMWKETDPELEKRMEQILSVHAEIWNNPAFTTNKSRSKQSKDTYVTDEYYDTTPSTIRSHQRIFMSCDSTNSFPEKINLAAKSLAKYQRMIEIATDDSMKLKRHAEAQSRLAAKKQKLLEE
ncbi:9921_t:CDS:2, partial [Funneliformis mosseae]